MYNSYAWRSCSWATRLLATIGNSGREEPLTIIGPEGIENVITGLRTIVPYLPYDIVIIENPKESLNVNVLKNGMEVLKEYGSGNLIKNNSLKDCIKMEKIVLINMKTIMIS